MRYAGTILIQEIAKRRHKIHPNQVSTWKQRAVEGIKSAMLCAGSRSCSKVRSAAYRAVTSWDRALEGRPRTTGDRRCQDQDEGGRPEIGPLPVTDDDAV